MSSYTSESHLVRPWPVTSDMYKLSVLAFVLQGSRIAAKDGKKLLKDTTFFLAVTPTGGLSVEAQTPGTLAQQAPLFIGEYKSRRLTAAVVKAFVGLNAIDSVGSFDIGGCFLFFANGFKLTDQPNNPNQFLEGDGLKGCKPEILPASVDLFKLPNLGAKNSVPLLVNRIGRRERTLARRKAAMQ